MKQYKAWFVCACLEQLHPKNHFLKAKQDGTEYYLSPVLLP
jgi:hypothetical protein